MRQRDSASGSSLILPFRLLGYAYVPKVRPNWLNTVPTKAPGGNLLWQRRNQLFTRAKLTETSRRFWSMTNINQTIVTRNQKILNRTVNTIQWNTAKCSNIQIILEIEYNDKKNYTTGKQTQNGAQISEIQRKRLCTNSKNCTLRKAETEWRETQQNSSDHVIRVIHFCV